MKRFYRFFVTSFALLSLISLESSGANAQIIGIGDLAGSTFRSRASSISGDGTTVTGFSNASDGQEAFKWTEASGIMGLGDIPGGRFNSRSMSASQEGSVIVGMGTIEQPEATRWDSAGLTRLGSLITNGFSVALGVSDNGSIIVGQAQGNAGFEAMYWNATDGMVGIGDLRGPGFDTNSLARAVSSDGSTIAGQGFSDDGMEAFRWTSGGGMVGLGDLTGGTYASMATSISGNGNVIAGHGQSANGQEAFRWTDATGMVALGDLAGGEFASSVNGMSVDGGFLVGYSVSSIGSEAFLWTATDGMQSLYDQLHAKGHDMSHWTNLISATGVSDDGLTIVGYGTNTNGDEEGFVARFSAVPEPTSVTFLAITLTGSLLFRRRRMTEPQRSAKH